MTLPDPEPAIDRIGPTRRPVGRRPVMYQTWRSLLFLHWAFPPEQLRPLLPPGLEVDTFGGQAYVGLVPFTMRSIRPRGLPAVPWLSYFHETNVRTYVHVGGRDPGVWFFSLDAANPLAVALARAWFHLPYYYARMGLQSGFGRGTGPSRDNCTFANRILYQSERFRPGRAVVTSYADCLVHSGEARPAAPGTLDHFLIERYLLYTVRRGRLHSGQVHHAPYPVQNAEVLAYEETMLAASGIIRPDRDPIVHASTGVDVEIFSLRAVPRP